MTSTRLILSALVCLSLGLLLWVDPSNSITGALPTSISTESPLISLLFILAGVVLGGMTLTHAPHKPEPVDGYRTPEVHDPFEEPVIIKREKKNAEEKENGAAGGTSGEDVGIQYAEEQVKASVRFLRINSKSDITTAQELLRDGPCALIMNISRVTTTPEELKQWLRILEHTAKAQSGKVLGLDQQHILATSQMDIRR